MKDVAEAHERLIGSLKQKGDQKWLKAIEKTQWLSQVSDIIRTARAVALRVRNREGSVLLQCPTGFDTSA